jgi:WD40 repeat protein
MGLKVDVGRRDPFSLADDAGTLVAAGSPERVVRLWDPRTDGAHTGQSIAGLIGHTDNIRAILFSQDGRHVSHARSSIAPIALGTNLVRGDDSFYPRVLIAP